MQTLQINGKNVPQRVQLYIQTNKMLKQVISWRRYQIRSFMNIDKKKQNDQDDREQDKA